MKIREYMPTASISEDVTSDNTAVAMGSGSLEVYATPSMIALMEAAAVLALESYVPKDSTSVGTLVNVSHIKSSKIGERITAKATLIADENKKYMFLVEAVNERGETVGSGIHERCIVNIERFMNK